MANTSKGAGNMLVPLAVVAVVVVGALVLTFTLSGDEPPSDATVVAQEGVDERPAGAGSVPDGAGGSEEEGVSGEELQDVDPASPDEGSVPAAEAEGGDATASSGSGTDDGGQGSATGDSVATEVPATEEGAATSPGQAEEGQSQETVGEAGTGGADGEISADADDRDSSAETGDDAVEDAETEGFPAGRDAQTELNPDPGQEVVRDDDEGGTGFVPTPSGPQERTGDDPAN